MNILFVYFIIISNLINQSLFICNIIGKLDNIDYDFFIMKDKDFVMKLMSTYGSLTVSDNQKATRRYYKSTDKSSPVQMKQFKYCEPFANHYLYRHSVDDHNNLRQSMPAIEKTWVTHRWPTRVFQFLLAISEVNTYKAFVYFIWKDEEFMTLHEFRRKLANSLINNDYLYAEKEEIPSINERKKRRKQLF